MCIPVMRLLSLYAKIILQIVIEESLETLESELKYIKSFMILKFLRDMFEKKI